MSFRPVHCKGCGRTVAFSTWKTKPPAVFCTELCAQDIPIDGNEERDSFIEAMRQKDVDIVSISKVFHIAHQRVSQILHRRRKLS